MSPGMSGVYVEGMVGMTVCRFCGGVVEGRGVDYCRGCYYRGATMSESSGACVVIGAMVASLPELVAGASVDHTGGGCFVVSARVVGEPGDVFVYVSEYSAVDDVPSDDHPWIVGVYDFRPDGTTRGVEGRDRDGDVVEYRSVDALMDGIRDAVALYRQGDALDWF